VDWSGELHGWRAAVTALGGIALNLATGGVAWGISRRLPRPGLFGVGMLLFGAGSVAGAIVYLADGLYYGSGDPLGFAPESGDLSRAQWVWVLFLPVAAFTSWGACRHLAESMGEPLTADRARSRIGWFLATLGVAGLAYGGLWFLLRQPDKEGSTRQWRMEHEVARETERRIAAQPVPPPTAPAPAPRPTIVVRPEEVKDRMPSWWGPVILHAMFVLGGVGGLWKTLPARGELHLSGLRTLGLAAAALGAAAACRLLG
jgi:hypothetical protein